MTENPEQWVRWSASPQKSASVENELVSRDGRDEENVMSTAQAMETCVYACDQRIRVRDKLWSTALGSP